MSRSITINGKTIDDSTDAYVIAEIGHNHQGSVEKAKEMIQAAKMAGASAVKLQKRDNRALFTKEFFEKPYENENSFGATYGEHREALEFDKGQYQQVIDYSKEIGIDFFATAFDVPSVHFLAELDIPVYKVASGDLTTTPLIEEIAKVGKPMIISTGAATMEDVVRGYEAARKHNDQVAILQCTSGYPCTFEEMNLNVITTYREKFPEAVIGLSGHDNGIAMAVVAYVLGARILEKHFTLDRAMRGTDHAFSLEPMGMRRVVRDMQRTRVALGTGEKICFESELPAKKKMGKQLVATKDLSSGHTITAEDVTFKSPTGGLPPYELENLIGKTLSRDVAEDEPFVEADLG